MLTSNRILQTCLVLLQRDANQQRTYKTDTLVVTELDRLGRNAFSRAIPTLEEKAMNRLFASEMAIKHTGVKRLCLAKVSDISISL